MLRWSPPHRRKEKVLLCFVSETRLPVQPTVVLKAGMTGLRHQTWPLSQSSDPDVFSGPTPFLSGPDPRTSNTVSSLLSQALILLFALSENAPPPLFCLLYLGTDVNLRGLP